MALHLNFCDEHRTVAPGETCTVGRDADLVVDDNPFLHRRFLELRHLHELYWLTNIGGQLSATLADDAGLVQAWLPPGTALPILFRRSSIWFTAGPTTYEIEVAVDDAPFIVVSPERIEDGTATLSVSLTHEQRMLVVALAEPLLRREARSSAGALTSSEAAVRLGWTLTKFNRKLDQICHKLERSGVQGLHGGPGRLASNRRSRLVEYAMASRLVQTCDLELLEAPKARPSTPQSSTSARTTIEGSGL